MNSPNFATAQPAPAPASAPQGKPPVPWAVGEVLSGAWNVFTRNWAPLVVSFLIVGVIVAIPLMIAYIVGFVAMGATAAMAERGGGDDAAQAVMIGVFAGVILVAYVLMMLGSTFFEARLVRMWLLAVRGGQPQIGDIFKGETRFGSMLGFRLLFGLMVGLGYFFCMVPSIIFMLGFGFAPFFITEHKMGAIDAMKASWNVTRGHKGQLFVFALLSFLIYMGASFIPVGGIVAGTILAVAWTIIHLRLMGEHAPAMPAAPAWAAQAAYPQQPGGYGQPGGYPPAGGYGAPPR